MLTYGEVNICPPRIDIEQELIDDALADDDEDAL